MNLYQQLIIAYNSGYIFEDNNYNKVINHYRNLFNELYISKANNQSIVENKTKAK